MKRLILIAGISAGGKTTAADKLGKYLNLPVLHLDKVYEKIADKTGIGVYKVLNDLYNDVKSMTVDIATKEILTEELEEKGDEMIIEGAEINRKEIVDLIKLITKTEKIVFMMLIPDYDLWIKIMNKKTGYPQPVQKWDFWKRFYYNQISTVQFPDYYFLFNDSNELIVEYNEYQRDGFTDEKWKRLKLKDLKGKSVLDLGCNSGVIGEYAIKEGAKYQGIDANWRHLQDCLDKKLAVEKFDLNDFAKNWVNKYDVVLCLAAIHYIKDKEAFIKRISEITKQYFVLEVPVYNGGETNLPSKGEVESWLSKYFSSYELVGDSVSPSPHPEYSKRKIYKAYVD